MKQHIRRPFVWLILCLLLLTAMIPAALLVRNGKSTTAHAAEVKKTPSISLSASVVIPSQTVNLTAQGFTPSVYVDLYLDSTSNFYFYDFVTDTSGNYSGPIQMAGVDMVQGLHTVIAVDSSNNTASTTVTYTPSFSLTVTSSSGGHKGGPGTPITLWGAAYNANESVSIFWGNTTGTPIATGKSDSQGNLTVKTKVPLTVTPGRAKVFVVRTHQTPSKLSAWFYVMTPDVDPIPAGIRGKQKVEVWASGFRAYEKVVISWNANGGQQLATFKADDTGQVDGTYKSPSAPEGSYALTATGKASNIQATSTIHVGPGISLYPNTQLIPGTNITVVGGGFTAGETVKLHIGGFNDAITVTVDSSGGFRLPFTLPTSYNQTDTQYYMHADSTTGTDKAKAWFTFLPVWADIPLGSTYGRPMIASGEGFASNEPVDIYWDYQQTQQTLLATVKAKKDGTFSVTVSTPSAPYQGSVPVAAVGAESKLIYRDTDWVYEAITLSPPSGRAGTTLQVNGGGFDANEQVTISFGSTTVATVTTDSIGGFAASYVVPAVNGSGDVVVKATGSTSGLSTWDVFSYPHIFNISPSSGSSSTVITVSGQQFEANYLIGIDWYDPVTKSQTGLGSFWSDSNGSFSGRVTIPGGLTGGQVYDVEASDGFANLTVQTPFVAQAPCVQCIQLTPNTAIPGSTISVQGSNFTAGETVNVYFQQTSNGIVSTTVSSSGTFTVSLTVPVAYKRKTNYYVYAVNTSGTEQASAQFLYTQPSLWLNDPYQQYTFGQQAQFDGSGFAADEKVNLFWEYGSPIGKVKAGSTTAASDGSISATVTYASIPYDSQINLAAIGGSSNAKATTPVSEDAAIYATPDSGYAGTAIQVQGGGFAKAETVTLSFEGTVVDTVTTDSIGSFVANFVVPSSDQMGYDSIIADGNSSGLSIETVFNSMPVLIISPTSGKSGTVITLNGSHFTPSEAFSIWWYDPSTNVGSILGSVTASSSGIFTTNITAPSNLTSGNVYYVQIWDNQQNNWTDVPFTAQ